MNHNLKIFSYRRVIFSMIAVLLLIVTPVNFALIRQQRQAHLNEAETQLSYQLQAAAAFITEPLLKYRFAEVEEFMRLWFAAHEDILLLEAHTPAGFLLCGFNRETNSPSIMTRQQEVNFLDQNLMTLVISKNYAPTEAILTQMRNRLLVISLTISAIMGLMLWGVFRRLALGPLEREIELRRRAEREMAAANQELDAFAYSVSHDLRTPLRGIDGFSQALLEDYDDKLDADGKNYLERIRSCCTRMEQLINDMLKLSRLSRGELRRATADLSAMAETIAAELQTGDPIRQSRFTIEPGVKVAADPVLIRAVLENLLGNAWKFTAKTPLAEISFGRVVRDGRPVCLVRDNGAGFDMAYADKLFTPFQRLHSSGEFDGTGIGLATVQRIIHRHGGRIWAEAEVGRGASFYFSLS